MPSIIDSGFAATTEGADEFITEEVICTGAIHWVDSVTGNNSYAGTEGKPLATLAQAVTNATANNGDIIILKSGHTETISSAVAISKAGLKIFGIGNGTSAPNFTVAAAVDCLNITGNNVEVNNLYFPVGTITTNTSRVNIDAANVRVKGCTFKCGAQDAETITLTANALYAEIESCSFEVTASGPTKGINIESASCVGLKIDNCSFDGGDYNWSTAAIYSNVAHLNYYYKELTLTEQAGITHTSSSSAKGVMSNIIDGDGSVVSA